MGSLWGGAHTFTESPYDQLWLLDGGFKRDSFVYYGSWEEDNSIVYRITTNTATVSKFLAPFTPIKANYVLLKVQLSAPDAAYNALKANALQGMLPPDDFKSALGDKNFMTAEPWAGFRGSEIREFVRTNESKILIEKREYNTMRVYTIVWAPNGDRCRLEGMDRFIWKVIGGELNVDNWTNFMRLAVSVTVGGSN
ncbi:hypothetical protein AU210_013316 [Fusarium oxysporum f. sp. radicis-cucumerinum]|uniref:Uncharacterized protein n=1 Tax=Fusarium oxysporum f. sp. radicis-cucumerinum TaxID=327505 RepID=A0A2H3G8L3_FUSOX|nr:hypothetical protein AU210_013316 [Fusarium oxysporum f. sp. radicis-cucumerinum]RKK96694.1 hypothetical protein BFJ71_g7648 [Fusarium oxysporum]